MTTELKPCWYCGRAPYRFHDGDDSGVECENCAVEARLNVKEWNSAWCWKEIDRLNAKIIQLENPINRFATLMAPGLVKIEIDKLTKERDAYRMLAARWSQQAQIERGEGLDLGLNHYLKAVDEEVTRLLDDNP